MCAGFLLRWLLLWLGSTRCIARQQHSQQLQQHPGSNTANAAEVNADSRSSTPSLSPSSNLESNHVAKQATNRLINKQHWKEHRCYSVCPAADSAACCISIRHCCYTCPIIVQRRYELADACHLKTSSHPCTQLPRGCSTIEFQEQQEISPQAIKSSAEDISP